MFRMLVNGALVDSRLQEPVLNPCDETVVALAPLADTALVDTAVDAAAQAFRRWRQSTQDERRAVLLAIAAQIGEHLQELAALLVQEQGRPLPLALFEMDLAIRYLNWFAEQSLDIEIQSDEAQRRVELHRVPLGVVAGIVPWNAPIHLAIAKIATTIKVNSTKAMIEGSSGDW